jgi:MFS family permease
LQLPIFAPTVTWLDALRVVQGIAAAAALASGSAALAHEFEGHALTKAFSMLGTTFDIGLAWFCRIVERRTGFFYAEADTAYTGRTCRAIA